MKNNFYKVNTLFYTDLLNSTKNLDCQSCKSSKCKSSFISTGGKKRHKEKQAAYPLFGDTIGQQCSKVLNTEFYSCDHLFSSKAIYSDVCF